MKNVIGDLIEVVKEKITRLESDDDDAIICSCTHPTKKEVKSIYSEITIIFV